MLPCRARVVLRWLEARVGAEGVYGDGGALMRGLEVVVVATRVVGDDDVGRWYVVWSAVLGSCLVMRAVASPVLGAVSWGTRMWTAYASWAGRSRSGRVG